MFPPFEMGVGGKVGIFCRKGSQYSVFASLQPLSSSLQEEEGRVNPFQHSFLSVNVGWWVYYEEVGLFVRQRIHTGWPIPKHHLLTKDIIMCTDLLEDHWNLALNVPDKVLEDVACSRVWTLMRCRNNKRGRWTHTGFITTVNNVLSVSQLDLYFQRLGCLWGSESIPRADTKPSPECAQKI